MAFGGLKRSIFPGTPVLTVPHPSGPCRNLMTLVSLLPVLLLLVMLPKAIPTPFLLRTPVRSPLKPTIWLLFFRARRTTKN